jgi:hypothetical protein
MSSVPLEDDVLDAFAAEPNHDAATFQRYLKDYPQYAVALIDLSRELSRESSEDEPFSERETAWIDDAVKRYSGESPPVRFAAPTVEQCRTAAKELRVPRQVITAVLDCRVAIDSISRRTLERLAKHFGATVEGLIDAISGPQTSASRSYKADARPSVGEKVSLERVLRDADVSDETIADLVAKDG